MRSIHGCVLEKQPWIGLSIQYNLCSYSFLCLKCGVLSRSATIDNLLSYCCKQGAVGIHVGGGDRDATEGVIKDGCSLSQQLGGTTGRETRACCVPPLPWIHYCGAQINTVHTCICIATCILQYIINNISCININQVQVTIIILWQSKLCTCTLLEMYVL